MADKNPNNCGTCRHKGHLPEGDGHCYMFRDAPTRTCPYHTGRHEGIAAIMQAAAVLAMKARIASASPEPAK